MAYLSNHSALRTTDLDQSREVMGSLWEKHTVDCRRRGSFRTQVNHVQLGDLGISYIDCATPLHIHAAPVKGHLCFQFFEHGATDYQLDGKPVSGTPKTAVLCSPPQEVVMQTEPARLFALRIPEDYLLSMYRTARPHHPHSVAWPTELDLSDRNVAALLAEIRLVARELNENRSLLQSTVAAHLEIQLKSLSLKCLLGTSRDHRLDFASLTRSKLADLELWIHANLDQPLSTEILAQKLCCSIRSLQLAFQRYRNCTPMQFVRQARLWAVRRKLREPKESRTNICAAAYKYGFAHLGRFTQHYREAFGETPSETLRQTPRI
ncbi:MAG: AraC family transcriptional regulator [Planctomycetota bacterium]